jgi:GNAT superfamily N-acetyltransferase
MPGSTSGRKRPPRRASRTRQAGRRRREPLRVRWAGVRDLPTLVRHRRRMWEEIRPFPAAELDRHDVVYRRWVREEMAAGRFRAVMVETRAGRPVGSGALWLMPYQPRPGPLGKGKIPYILSMYTEPGHRGRGVASRIVGEMVDWSRTHRYARVVLHASRFGRPVYERLGFEAGSEMRLELGRRLTPRRRSR